MCRLCKGAIHDKQGEEMHNQAYLFMYSRGRIHLPVSDFSEYLEMLSSYFI